MISATDRSESAPAVTPPRPLGPVFDLDAPRWGMIAFLGSEAAFFATLLVVYTTFLGRDTVGPTPSEALSLPLVLVTTVCLLSSSVTIHRAEKSLTRGDLTRFRSWWGATIGLGVAFLLGTAYEWHSLIVDHKLTISRNLFGSSYYTVVGFHGFHVSAGIVALIVLLGLTLVREAKRPDRTTVEMISWYWHFVDGVWVAVFAVVYLFGR